MVASSKTQPVVSLPTTKKREKKSTTTKRSDNQRSTGQTSIGESGTCSPSVTEGMGSISLDQGQRDVASVTQGSAGKCHQRNRIALGTMLAIDIAIGTSCVVYGALVRLTPVMAAMISYGSVLILGALAGVLGVCTGSCSQRGLQASAMVGFLVTLLDIGALITTLLLWDTFIVFLNENYDHLLLSEDSITRIQDMKIPLVVIFAVLALLEFIRGVVMITKANGGVFCCVAKRKRTEEFIRLDTSSLETPLLIWSQTRGQPTCDDFLECINNPVIDFSNVALPLPPEDMDY